MKKLILVLLITLNAFSAQSQTKVGTIDVDYILSKMPEITQVDEGLKTYNTKLQENLQTTIKSYEEKIADYQANNTSFSEEVKATKESEIIELENEIKGFRQKASALLQMRRNELTQPLYEKIDKAMQAVITEKKYTQIFTSGSGVLAFADAKYDITVDVLNKLGIKEE
jgi:outer membrane protein